MLDVIDECLSAGHLVHPALNGLVSHLTACVCSSITVKRYMSKYIAFCDQIGCCIVDKPSRYPVPGKELTP